MNFVKRAWLRITAHLGRTLILTGLLFVICAMALAGLMIQSAAGRAVAAAKASVGAVATMQLDLNAYLEAGRGTKSNGAAPGRIGDDANLYSGWADRIGRSGAVREYNYQLEGAVKPAHGAKAFDAVPPPADNRDAAAGLIMATGVRTSPLLADFRDGRSTLLSGEPITPATTGEKALIEERFAKANNLKVGDRLTLTTGELGVEPASVEFTVGGIYRNDTASNPQRHTPSLNEPGNNVFLTPGGASRLSGAAPGPNGAKIKQATFTLSGPDDLGGLRDAATAAGVDLKLFPVNLNTSRYDALVGPITATAGFANLGVWLILAAGAAILALLLAGAVRDRRHELGILLGLGEPKAKLIGQLLVELAACSIVATALAIPAAAVAAERVGGSLLAGEVAAAAKAVDERPDRSSTNGAKKPDRPVAAIDRIDVRIRATDVAMVAALGLGLAALATILPAAGILRLRPRDILSRS